MAVVRGTPNNDELFAPGTGDILLGLAGNDTLEGVSGEGNNTLRGGEDNDELTANTIDKLFGEAGNDILDATAGAGNNTLEGGEGVDTLFAGRNDIVFGGSGVDYLFAGVGPSFLIGGNANNLLTADNSGDLFAIVGQIPQSPAYIFDFTSGVDRIGIGGLGLTFADLEFVQQQNGNTLIRNRNDITQQLAILVNFQAQQLRQTDFLFNVDLNALPQLDPGTPVTNNVVTILDPLFVSTTVDQNGTVVSLPPNQIANGLVNINNYFSLQLDINSPGKQNIEFNNVLFTSNPAPDAPNNPELLGYDFSRGFLEFDINYQVLNVQQINEEIIATLILPDGVRANTYWNYGPEPGISQDHWYNFIYDGTTGAEFFFFDADLDGDDDQVILLHYVKGQRGDSALAGNVNNTIQTLGGPGFAANVNANLVFNQTSGALQIQGSQGVATNLQFNLDTNVSSADFTNEFGVFQVDNANGAIGNLNPGDAGYLEAALTRSEVIFSSLNDRSPKPDSPSRVVQFSSNSFLGLYLVSNGSAAEAIGGNGDNVFFSFSDSNNLRVDPANANNPLTINWEDLPASAPDLDNDFDDLVLTVEVVGDQPSLDRFIAHPQGKIEQEVVDLTQFAENVNVNVTFTVNRDADFNNFVGFYQIDNLAGEIVTANGTRLAPGDNGYAQAAIALRVSDIQVTGVNGQETSSINTLQGGAIYAPFIAINGNLNDVFFPFLGANSDNIDHVRLLGNNTFGFEDFTGGGDKDYNDLVVSIDFNVNVA